MNDKELPHRPSSNQNINGTTIITRNVEATKEMNQHNIICSILIDSTVRLTSNNITVKVKERITSNYLNKRKNQSITIIFQVHLQLDRQTFI